MIREHETMVTMPAFTPYLTVLSVVPVLCAVFLRRRRAAIAAALSTVILVSLFVPRVLGGPDPGTGPTLRVMSSNLKEGEADAANHRRPGS